MTEKEYIEREEIMQYLKDHYDWYARMIKEAVHWDEAKAYRVLQLLAVDMFEYFRDRAPAADVVPVVRGEWDEDKYPFCNVCVECRLVIDRTCIKYNSGKLNFCPNCGAKMDGVKRVYEI